MGERGLEHVEAARVVGLIVRKVAAFQRHAHRLKVKRGLGEQRFPKAPHREVAISFRFAVDAQTNDSLEASRDTLSGSQ